MADLLKPNVRIVDIARMAGVSVGTVDRVIHNRGKVSEENLRKIRTVLERVDYRPNIVARSLASARQYRLSVLIPQFAQGEYWADVNDGVMRAAAEIEHFNVAVQVRFFDQYDPLSFVRALAKVRGEKFDGVLVATLFTEEVADYSRELDEGGVPYVFLDSDIPGCNRLSYFGTSSSAAGELAARLLQLENDRKAGIVVGTTVRGGVGGSNQWRNREAGFRDYLSKSGFRGNLYDVPLQLHDEAHNTRVLDELFRAHSDIRGAVTFNSTCFLLGDYLRRSGRTDIRLVGYDLIARNEEMLLNGTVAALIAQRPETQGYNGVIALYEHLVGGRKVRKVHYMPIDILLKENIRYYKNNTI